MFYCSYQHYKLVKHVILTHAEGLSRYVILLKHSFYDLVYWTRFEVSKTPCCLLYMFTKPCERDTKAVETVIMRDMLIMPMFVGWKQLLLKHTSEALFDLKHTAVFLIWSLCVRPPLIRPFIGAHGNSVERWDAERGRAGGSGVGVEDKKDEVCKWQLTA